MPRGKKGGNNPFDNLLNQQQNVQNQQQNVQNPQQNVQNPQQNVENPQQNVQNPQQNVENVQNPQQKVQNRSKKNNENVGNTKNAKSPAKNNVNNGNKSDDKLIAKKIGTAGSVFLKVKLENGVQISTSPGSMLYLKGDVDKGIAEYGSFKTGIVRLFGGEDFFLTKYSGLEKGGEIALGSDIPGDIIEIPLKENTEWYFSRGSYLCSTPNIIIESVMKTQGLFGIIGSSEGGIMPTIKTTDGKPGRFWLSAYGSFEKIELGVGEKIIIDNGYFLACEKKMNYAIEKLGKTLFSSFLGGEGFGMLFVGPGTIYTQSKNVANLAYTLSVYMPRN
jgi:uncharacterized protein (AIM24 family)